MPDKSSALSVGEKIIDNNCTVTYSCPSAGSQVVSTPLVCSEFSVCGADADGNRKCVCKDGYFGDGFKCSDSKKNL